MNFNRDDSAPIRFTPGKERYSADNNSDVGTRPTGDPKSTKNFQKILRKNPDDKGKDGEEKVDTIEGDEDSQGAMSAVDEKALKSKQPAASLFELSSNAAKNPFTAVAPKIKTMDRVENKMVAEGNRDNLAPSIDDTEDATESPAALYAKMSSKEQKKINTPIEHPTERTIAVHEPVKLEEKKEKINTRFATEQTDLSYVNPLALNTQPIQPTSLVATKPVLSPINVQDIINQLVEKVVQMETSDRTDTVITLKHPPILAGADLVVTGFDSAKGEFNITFQRLTQAAKDLLDMHANQQSLLLALEQKGYAVHIVTTTTLAEISLPTTDATGKERDRNQEQEQGRGQGQSKQK